MRMSSSIVENLLSHLAEEGYDLDLRNPILDVEKTIRKLKRAGVDIGRLSLPSGIARSAGKRPFGVIESQEATRRRRLRHASLRDVREMLLD